MSEIIGFINRAVREHGVKKCVVVAIGFLLAVLVVGNVLIWLFGIEKDVQIEPMFSEQSIVYEDEEIQVTRTTKAGERISIAGVIGDTITSISSEAEAIAAFNQLVESCDNMSQKKDKIVLPAGAGGIEFNEIRIYGWKRMGKRLLTEGEFAEVHMVMFLNGQYVYVTLDASEIAFGANIEMGTY